jgi:CO/xanthine dehydrogenase FAD-binding subunit
VDLNTIGEIVAPRDFASMPQWREGDAFLGGGTYLYSEPQLATRRLIDLDALGWKPIEITDATLSIAATCKIRQLKDCPRPADWTAGHLIEQCCNALLGSFKIWNMATVGGNICLSLPAGPMSSLAASLGATCVIWGPGGAKRSVPMENFIIGNRLNVLRPGELFRSIDVPLAALRTRAAFRQVSLTPRGRSGALVIGTLASWGEFALTVSAATVRPVRMTFSAMPSEEMLHETIDYRIPPGLYHDDIHGLPAWRRHLTHALSVQILGELSGAASA